VRIIVDGREFRINSSVRDGIEAALWFGRWRGSLRFNAAGIP